MLPLPLTFGLVPILLDCCKCGSSWICIFVSKPYVFVRTLLWQFDSQIDLPLFCFVCESSIGLHYNCYLEVHWIRTFDHWSFEFWAYYPHRLMFLYILVSPDLFHALLSLFDKIEPRVLPWLDRHWVFPWKHYFVRLLDSYPQLFDSIDS